MDAVTEAVCLLAVLALPLYFSVLTSGYEPDKAVFLRVLACVGAAAWIAGMLLDRRSVPTLRAEPLFWLAILLFAAYCLATVFSIDPRQSLWGSHGRQEGLWTRASYLVFFVIAATRLRSADHLQRLVSLLVIGSVPVVVYGFLQEFNYDPVSSSGSPDTLQWPVWATFGQHVFFGSYLVLVIPFTAGRLLRTWDAWATPAPGWYRAPSVLVAAGALGAMVVSFFVFLAVAVHQPTLFAVFPALLALYVLVGIFLHSVPSTAAVRRAQAAGYAVLLVLQLLTLTYTGARASFLGVLASLPVFAFLVALRLRRPGISRSILGLTAAGALCLVLLNIPNGPLQPLRTIHGLNRIANITDSGGAEGSAQGRLFIWQGVGKLMTETPQIGDTWGGFGRLVVGYGPESMPWAFERVFPLKLRQVNSQINVWDRAHNIYLDYLVDAGVLALGALVALLVYFFWRVLLLLPKLDDTRAWILIPLGAAMAGHLVDGFFGIEIAFTLLVFWLFVGIVANMSRHQQSEDSDRLSAIGGTGRGESQTDNRRPTGDVVLTPWFGQGRLGWLTFGALALLASGLLIPASGHPAFLAVIWLLCVVGGMGAVALALCGPIQPPRARLVPDGRALLIVTLIGLAGIVGLPSQFRYETAAIADSQALAELSQGHTTQALTLVQEAVQTNGYDPQYRTDLAKPYFILGASHGDSAEPAYIPAAGDAKSIDPERVVNLGRDQLFGLDRFALDSARSLAPLDPDAYNNLGQLYLQWNKPLDALREFVRAERLSPQNPRYLDFEALSNLTAKRNRMAADQALAALRLDTTFWLSHFTMAVVAHQLGNKPEARSEAALALYWVRNYWPPPPSQQLDVLRNLQRTG